MSATNKNPNSALASLHRFEFILQQKSDSLLRTSVGVGFGQVQILQTLQRSVPQSQKLVATKLYQTEANISRQLQLLRKKGLVSITRNSKDRRIREVGLTSKGELTVEKARSILADQHKSLLRLTDKKQLQEFDLFIKNLLRAL